MNDKVIEDLLREIRDDQRIIKEALMKTDEEAVMLQKQAIELQIQALENQRKSMLTQARSVNMQTKFSYLYKVVLVVMAFIVAYAFYKLNSLFM